ncbi:MAG: hypothetical protein ACREJD_17415 [Phycisphaerales bacterium]
MNRSTCSFSRALIAFVVFASGWAAAHAQSTAFTYQGRLESAGSPANGLFDLQFRLFDAATVGTQVGPTLCLANTTVDAGVLTVQLDFGAQFASTALRYIEIQARPSTGLACANATGFIVLSPRQQVTVAPRASMANTAFGLSAPDGSPAQALSVDNSGNIGIGTAAPLGILDVRTGTGAYVRIDSTNGDLHTNGGTDGFFGLYNEGLSTGRTEFIWNTTVNMGIANSGGWVGIGTTPVSGTKLTVSGNSSISGTLGVGTASPGAKLDVRGDIKLGSAGQFFAPAGEENLRIVRGVVDAAGNKIVGAGFIVVHDAPVGYYHITFTTPFSAPPAVTITVDASSLVFGYAMTDGVNAGEFELLLREDGAHQMNAPFHFIAIGPR